MTKRVIKKYHLKESIKNKIQEIIFTLLIIIFGALVVVGLFTIYQAKIERVGNNQNIINNK